MTMLGMRPLFVVLSLGVLASASNASADSVYLKNGRVIRTALARVDGQQVVFTQYGGEQSIPVSVVERVVVDDHVGPAQLGSVPARATRVRMPATLEGSLTEAAAPVPQPTLPQAIAGLMAPESLGALSGLLGSEPGAITGLLSNVGTEIEGIERVLPLLPRLIAAFRQPVRSQDEARTMLDELLSALSELGVSRADIMERARRYGVPEDWIESF
ncbi:MAG TPA: hypothetical protein QGG47_00705 [Acidobacteriota bacterium]|nr:hypothetical protein [Acidobacteriota bacterium]